MTQSQKPVPSDPSEIAARYQVVQRLGAGAFGTVYKARDKVLGRMVAIKTIRLEGLAASGASIEELVERFQREARVSAQLKHPNIVTIYDVGESDGTSYLAMEFIDGVGLDRMIAGERKLSTERVAIIGSQVADALDFAHRHNVVHRDIKPANIMIEGVDRVKVTDFGIAKATDSGEHLTMTGSLLGTPSYMSPEQARGAELDGRSDLFAAGCVLYEMATGKKAFRGDSITGLIFKIITEEPPPIHDLDPSVPDELIRIIAKALSKSPTARYQSGRELADELLPLTRPGATPTLRQSDTPTAAVATTAQTPTRMMPATVSPTVAMTPTMAGPPPTQASRPKTARAAASPASVPMRPEAAPSSRLGLLLGLAALGFFVVTVAGAGWYFWTHRAAPSSAAGPNLAPSSTFPRTEPSPSAMAQPGASATLSPEPASTIAGTAEGRPPGALPIAPPPVAIAQRPPAAPVGGVTPPNAGAIARVPDATESERDAFLEQGAPEVDGREAGEALADRYRQGRPTGFGTSRRFQARARNPTNLGPVERVAVATMRYVMNAEEIYNRKEGRYGSLADLVGARILPLESRPNGDAFQRKGYRYELSAERDGFRITATPLVLGPRAFTGDDGGFIQ